MFSDKKPKYIECLYTVPVVWDLEELEIDWSKVKDHYIKYGSLNITYNDGTEKEYYGDFGETDYKWADKEGFYDKDWNEVNEEDFKCQEKETKEELDEDFLDSIKRGQPDGSFRSNKDFRKGVIND